MTWTTLPVATRIVDCEPPFSFYFELIEPLWKANPADNQPLHRLATLCRKQGAKAIVIEDAASTAEVAAEIDGIDVRLGGGGSAEAILISFLSELPKGDDLSSVSDSALVGQCVLINYRAPRSIIFHTTFIMEAVFSTPMIGGSGPLLNNYVNCSANFSLTTLGRQFQIQGVCYAQQNTVSSVCAHASIRMVTRTLFPDRIMASNEEINKLVDASAATDGMFPDQIADVLRKLTGYQVSLIDCVDINPAEYVSILTAATDSGDLALLTFKTGAPAGEISIVQNEPAAANHVVVVFGHTRNSDEWHPQAIPKYSGLDSALYCPSSSWVDHFLIHDDNFGPYFALSSRALESDPTVRAESILIIRKHYCSVEAHVAEATAATFLSHMLPTLVSDSIENKWLNHVTRVSEVFVTRPILLTRDEYCDHVSALVAHDGTKLNGHIAPLVENLPNIMWMVEFTLPDLFTGNRTKLGEVLLETVLVDGASRITLIRWLRLPSLLLVADGQDRSMTLRSFPVMSHCDIYMRRPQPYQW